MNLHPVQMEAAQQYPWSFFMVIKTGHLLHFHLLNRGWGLKYKLTLSSPEKGVLIRVIRGRGLFEGGGGVLIDDLWYM